MALFTNLLPISQPRGLIRHDAILIPKYRVAAFHGHFTCSGGGQSNDLTAPKLSHQKQRGSSNYPPPIWDNELLQTTKNEYAGGMFIERSNVLKEQVKMMLNDELNPMHQLELIDDLQRLGIFYHFEDQIQSILRRIYNENINNIMQNKKGLYETALEFRLLRQHHFDVRQEVFDCFRCEKGDFEASLSEDTKGLLYLYEASFLLTENESTLELAREFASKNLKRNLQEKTVVDEELASLVRHALKLPLHWRMLRLEARWFIDLYEKRPNRNTTILELAKLDFNIVQATYQMDLEYVSRWWKSTGFADNLRFARDELVENFYWTIGEIFNPQYGYWRRMSTKVNAFITTIDDIYDIYGTLDDLEIFTDAVKRWDIGAIDQLPDYMKICYHELYNSINDMAYDISKEQQVHIIPYISNAWADLCRAYLQEAKWSSSGYIPTLQEYLNNAWISSSIPVVLVHAYFLLRDPIKKEELECLDDPYPNIIRCSAMILRLLNDLETPPDEWKKGDVPKSIQCYMNESGTSEAEAREYIKSLMNETWKEMNKEQIRETPFSETFIGIAMNVVRTAHCIYKNGHGNQYSINRERISAQLFEPVCLAKLC